MIFPRTVAALGFAGWALASSPAAHARPWLPGASEGNQATLLVDGRESFDQRTRNIKDADVILYKSYIFADDGTGRQTVDLLAHKARAGAKVFVQYDVKGTSRGPWKALGIALGQSPIPPQLQPLVDAGATLIPTNTPTLRSPFFGRDHDKVLITWKANEAARAIVGGMNVGDEHRRSGEGVRVRPGAPAFRDTDIELVGPAAQQVVDRYLVAASRAQTPAFKDLVSTVEKIHADRASYVSDHGTAKAQIFYNRPADHTGKQVIEDVYDRLMRRTPTGQTITISNAYLLPSPKLQKSIVDAARRGVKFQFLENSTQATAKEASIVAVATESLMRKLLKQTPPGSIAITEFRGNVPLNQNSLHQKIAAFGTHGPVVVGSANLDPLSSKVNSETIAVVQDPKVRQRFDAVMKRDLTAEKSRDITESIRKAPWLRRAKQWIVRQTIGRRL